MNLRKSIAFCEHIAEELRADLREERFEPEWSWFLDEGLELLDQVTARARDDVQAVAAFATAPPAARAKLLLQQPDLRSAFVLLIAAVQYVLKASAVLREIQFSCQDEDDPKTLLHTAHRVVDAPDVDRRAN